MTRTPFTLFHLARCPFCLRVRRAAAALGLELDLVEITENPEARAHLLAHRGRATVPVLHIPGPDGGTLLPESADIIAFLERWAADHTQAAA